MSDKIRAYLLDNMQDALADELDAELAELEGAQDRRDKWCKLAVDMINELRDDYAPGDLGELDGVKAIRKLRTALDEARKVITDLRDLARTGLPVGDMQEREWDKHRLNVIAGDATTFLKHYGGDV